MPSSPLALGIALSLVPGYVYLQLSQSIRKPGAKSALGELLELLTMGVATTGIALVGLTWREPSWVLRTVRTSSTNPADVSADDLTSAAKFGATLLIFAVGAAVIIFVFMRLLRGRTFAPSAIHATLGLDKPGYGRHVGVTFNDGTTIDGVLHAYSMSDDDASRTISLKRPLRFTTKMGVQHQLPFDYYMAFGANVRGVSMVHVRDSGQALPKPRRFRKNELVITALLIILVAGVSFLGW